MCEMKIFSRKIPKNLTRFLSAQGAGAARLFSTDTGLSVILSLDISPGGKSIRQHISASGRNIKRLPEYYELRQLRYELCQDVRYMAEIFPPEEEFVNADKYCRHLFEIDVVSSEFFGRR